LVVLNYVLQLFTLAIGVASIRTRGRTFARCNYLVCRIGVFLSFVFDWHILRILSGFVVILILIILIVFVIIFVF